MKTSDSCQPPTPFIPYGGLDESPVVNRNINLLKSMQRSNIAEFHSTTHV